MMLLQLLLGPEWLWKMGTSCHVTCRYLSCKIHEAIGIGYFFSGITCGRNNPVFSMRGMINASEIIFSCVQFDFWWSCLDQEHKSDSWELAPLKSFLALTYSNWL